MGIVTNRDLRFQSDLNKKIPAYSAVGGYEILFDPFAKTPKGSIKRFMYR